MTGKQKAKLIRDLSAVFEPKIARAFIDSIQNIKDSITLKEVENLIKRGRFNEAVLLISEASVAEGSFALASAVQASYIAGGNLAERFAQAKKVKIQFNVVNPKVAQRLDHYKTFLVQNLTRTARESVTAAIKIGIGNGDGPLTIARAFKDSIGLTANQLSHVNNLRRELSGEVPSSRLLNRLLLDGRDAKTIARAISEQKPLDAGQIDRITERYYKSYVSYRANTIARTESIRSVQEGNRSLYEQAIFEGKVLSTQVRRFWEYTHDDKVREAHEAIPDMNPDGVGMDEPFQTPLGSLMYPCDPDGDLENTINCRCTVYTEITPI